MIEDKLYDMARNYYNHGYFRVEIRDILQKNKRTQKDDGVLLKYLFECQEKQFERKDQSLSIRDMKNTIFNLIGKPEKAGSSYSYQSQISKDDMVAIYNFITSLPGEFLAEDKGKI